MIIEQEKLLSMLGYRNAGSAEKCLKDAGIPVLHGKDGRISTTLQAINAALLDQPRKRPRFEID